MAEMKVMTLDVFQYFVQQKLDPALEGKVDKVDGKQLSTNDYTTAEKTKLAGVAEGAQVNVIEKVSVNGTALAISSKGVNVDLTSYAKSADVESTYAKKTDITTVMRYKGVKATVAELPSTGNTVGDVWHISAASQGEYAWDGTEWQELGSVVDLSGYYTKSEVDAVDATKADKTYVDTELATKVNASDLVAVTTSEIDALFA